MSAPRDDRFVLLVEDDVDVKDSLALALSIEGYRVRAARHGREALEVLARDPEQCCLIFLDIMMPVMDGFEFLRRKKQLPALASVPTVVLSAYLDGEPDHEEVGVEAWLHKPVDLDDVLNAAERWCR